ncbi:thiosulfate:glutathione sulfurtransferase [Chanos chanos]|uniref:Thiosulfate:glutathione sulfurtransferase n=1 Tax=Chanos chanos TaxID=29144 RepID=A0A6J2V139_CHACN|nr:thiosulfate:glutathione sulfurtransferase-like [Chanos chanos]
MISYQFLRRICLSLSLSSVNHCRLLNPTCRSLTTSSAKYNDSSSKDDAVVSYEQLKAMLSTHSVQLFDVRKPDEYQAGRIPDAVNIPLGHLEESLKLSPQQFELLFEVKAPRKDDDNIVFHCLGGIRSSKALQIARDLGFSRARHFPGGYSEWAKHEKKQ